MRARFFILGLCAAFAACSTLAYKDDIAFLVSAQANSPEFPVEINGKLCRDMAGRPGLCATSVNSSESIRFSIPAQPYSYHLTLTCSSGIQGIDATVPEKVPFEFTLKPSDFERFLLFSCSGRVNPQDREARTSSLFHVRFMVVDSQYQPREEVFIYQKNDDHYLVLGAYALHSRVFDNGRWKSYKKKTTIKIQGDPKKVKAYSESYAARWNYYGHGE